MQSLMTVQTAESQMKQKVQIKTEAGFRLIESNGIPDHKPGEFPRRGNPNAIKPQSYQFRMTLKPVAVDEPVRLRSEISFKLDSQGLVSRIDNNVTPRCLLYKLYW